MQTHLAEVARVRKSPAPFFHQTDRFHDEAITNLSGKLPKQLALLIADVMARLAHYGHVYLMQRQDEREADQDWLIERHLRHGFRLIRRARQRADSQHGVRRARDRNRLNDAVRKARAWIVDLVENRPDCCAPLGLLTLLSCFDDPDIADALTALCLPIDDTEPLKAFEDLIEVALAAMDGSKQDKASCRRSRAERLLVLRLETLYEQTTGRRVILTVSPEDGALACQFNDFVEAVFAEIDGRYVVDRQSKFHSSYGPSVHTIRAVVAQHRRRCGIRPGLQADSPCIT